MFCLFKKAFARGDASSHRLNHLPKITRSILYVLFARKNIKNKLSLT